MPSLEIVVVSWNTEDLTKECLTSLFEELASTGIDALVWVVDNSSSDGSVKMLKNHFPQVRLIENRENVGFARANNQVLRQATAPYLLLLNSDTLVRSESISRMMRLMQERMDIAAVGPRLEFPDGGVQRSFTRLPSPTGELKYCLAYHFFPFDRAFHWLFGFGGHSWEQDRSMRRVDVLSAACLLARKEVFDRIGLLAENYFLFSEENDLFCRMKRAGYASYYFPEATIVHVVGASRRKRGNLDSQVNFLKSRMLYFRRFHPRSFGWVRGLYGFFLGWSLAVARLSALLKTKKDSDYTVLYSRLRETLAEARVES